MSPSLRDHYINQRERERERGKRGREWNGRGMEEGEKEAWFPRIKFSAGGARANEIMKRAGTICFAYE